MSSLHKNQGQGYGDGLLIPVQGCVALLIAKDGMYADFARAKIWPCSNSAVGVICEPGALRSNPPFRQLNKKGHLLGGLFYLIGRDGRI